MKKTTSLKIVNVALLLVFIIQANTGILLSFSVGPFSELSVIHRYFGYTFILLTVAHLIMNRQWLITSFLKSRPKTSAAAEKTGRNPAPNKFP
jgi:heme A synthase